MMTNKRNLKRAIAKFEELAADDNYEGNQKIINLDKFLKSDLKKRKKKRDTTANLESTPIKCNNDKDREQLMNDTFDQTDDNSSTSEIKTADQFLKQFISQPPLKIDKPKFKKSSNERKNKSTNLPVKISKKLSTKSLTKSLTKAPSSKESPTKKQQKSDQQIKMDGYKKLKEKERQFFLNLQRNQRSFNEDLSETDEDYDEELDDEELDEEFDEELDEEFDEELDEEFDEEELKEKINEQKELSLDYESITPENIDLNERFIREQQLKYELSNGSISHLQEELSDEEITSNEGKKLKKIAPKERQQTPSSKFTKLHQESSKLNQLSHQSSKLVKSPIKQNKAICKSSSVKYSQSKFDKYIGNFHYQRSATEELYNLIMKSEECSYNILIKLVKNIKQTLGCDELPDPSRVKPFFHFTPDNENSYYIYFYESRRYLLYTLGKDNYS